MQTRSKIKNTIKIAAAMITVLGIALGDTGSLIPGVGSDLYYQIGGGDITPVPYDTGEDITLSVSGDAGLGFNCGAFDPAASIINSLNGIEGSFGGIQNEVYQDLTGMIIGEGGYLLAKAMPNVYKYASDGIGFGQHSVSIASKSCETMMQEVSQGQNPNTDMVNVAMGQDWQYHMSLASGSQMALGLNNNDIVAVKSEVDQDAGKNGVEWVHGVFRNGSLSAGGVGEPAIHLMRDSILAGYNILIGNHRAYDDTSTPLETTANTGIVSVFPTPMDAANFAIYALGENVISTYPGGEKSVVPGKGLLFSIQQKTSQFEVILNQLVSKEKPLTLNNLHELDSPQVMLSPEVIHALSQINNPTLQAIYIHRIAQGIATNGVMNEATLTRQFLSVALQVPAISANHVAVFYLQSEIKSLDAMIHNLQSTAVDSRLFLTNAISALLSSAYSQELQSASIQPTPSLGPIMSQGAVKEA